MVLTPSHSKHTSRHARSAFTIIELLVSVVIIFILITTALYALRVAKRGADRTQSLNALRQMMTAYNGYTTENKGRFMPGYIDEGDLADGSAFGKLKIRLSSGHELQDGDVSSYVWRLAPYMDHAWKTYMVDYRSSEMMSQLEWEYSCGSDACPAPQRPGGFGPASLIASTDFGIARCPSFGLNSLFVGGDSSHAGLGSVSPWTATDPNDIIAATRLSQVKSPPKLIVFGATQARGISTPTTGVTVGYCELRPPYADYNANTNVPGNQQWYIETAAGPMQGQPVTTGSFAGTGGLPIDRLGDEKIPLGFLDGSVGTELLGRLEMDMSRWSPFAVSTR